MVHIGVYDVIKSSKSKFLKVSKIKIRKFFEIPPRHQTVKLPLLLVQFNFPYILMIVLVIHSPLLFVTSVFTPFSLLIDFIITSDHSSGIVPFSSISFNIISKLFFMSSPAFISILLFHPCESYVFFVFRVHIV